MHVSRLSVGWVRSCRHNTMMNSSGSHCPEHFVLYHIAPVRNYTAVQLEGGFDAEMLALNGVRQEATPTLPTSRGFNSIPFFCRQPVPRYLILRVHFAPPTIEYRAYLMIRSSWSSPWRGTLPLCAPRPPLPHKATHPTVIIPLVSI